jgi:hypothetical protein
VARADGLVTGRRAAELLGVSSSLVNLWVKHGVLVHDQRVPASKVWVRLTDEDLARLTGGVAEAISLPTFGLVRAQTGLSPCELWQQVAAGRYLAFRVRRGQTWQWHVKEICPTNQAQKPPTVRRNRKAKAPYE